jgi:prolyl oligopeptidase
MAAEDVDAFAWLEDVGGPKSLSWVKSENKHTMASLGDPTQSPLFTRVRNVLESPQRIPFASKIGGHLYNFWQDDAHVRGVWRRATLEEYKKAFPRWEIVLDVDVLGKAEGESWVWKNYVALHAASGEAQDLVLLQLSRGGADATVVREFNLTSRAFVPPPQGFFVKEAKTDVAYLSRDTVLIGSDFGKGSMTDSGYPRAIREWQRGTKLQEATIFFDGQASDVSVFAHRVHDRRGCIYDMRGRATAFYSSQTYIRIVAGPGADSAFVHLDLPEDAAASTFATELLVQTRSLYAPSTKTSFPPGSLISAPLAAFLHGKRDTWTELFVPSDKSTLHGYAATKNFIVVQVLHAVKTQLIVWRFTGDGVWVKQTPRGLQEAGKALSKIANLNVWAFDSHESDRLWVQESGFLRPTTLSLAASAAEPQKAERMKSLPEMFNASGLSVAQRWAVSDDGTRVPYFVVGRTSASKQPTLLYGYGGFRISQLPFYSAGVGALWLERGGVFALANIRGGGEFGPAWHQAAVKKNKHKSFEDFAAVARHLVSSGVTTPERLGIMGGSNGGFLVGNMLVKYPRLFGAVVCQVPLLDMRRYNKLLAGASWMAEYGNPDKPEEWAFLKHNSPYHNLDKHVRYPPVLFITSTRDDRVHPSHARKMTAKMQAFQAGLKNTTFLYENMEGGHGGAADAKQSAFMATLEYNFLWSTLRST